ncbi:histidine phosphatase family protein [Sphingobacterium bovistauri]|uniref:Histidine phosphatase family protein n=1 Tax=Sphingobacterium bovistauri TaxID=2781959 RepID=A0ABS7Z412_9SPHI|nr:histidine phosphatase family protein [Sphingobacterium bovistauri]MCA5004903.1 histidine phosphatase family protein [Sphingobacterium bovistauri]
MRKTFYFIRHGQTDLNLKGIVQGRGVNTSLNENGRKQADAFFNAYKHISFDKIYTSTLVRTHQTVEQFEQELGVSREDLVGLDEISWGIYEGKVQDETIMQGFHDLVSAWRNNDLDVHIENGESPNQLVKRQKDAISYILSKEDEKTILVCMHGRALRIMLCHLTGTPVSNMDEFPHTNTSLYVLSYENDKFEIIDHYNTTHLEGLE